MTTFDRIERPRSVSGAVARRIQEYLTAGALRPGDQLPSERDLASQLGVGRSSLREAIQALQTMGLVDVRHGVGTFLVAAPDSWLLEPLREQVAGRPPGELFSELIEARLVVETAIAEFAAARRQRSDVERLTSAVAECGAAADGVAAGVLVHLAIARAARNEVLGVMMEATSQLFHDVLESLQRMILTTDGGAAELKAFRANQQVGHERLLRAIVDGDPSAAADAMRSHLIELRNFYAHVASEPVSAA